MKILRFDSVGGASGDMILSALVGLGADLDRIRAALVALELGPFEIEAKAHAEGGLSGTQVTVTVPETIGHHHHGRHLSGLRRMIAGSALPETVQRTAIAVFERLADAEARVHNTTPEQVHFHEVGAVDSIVDIVGSCLGLSLLSVDRVEAGPLPEGHGWITMAHGVLPVPAPATVELLKGHAVVQVDEPFELVTPTGAALLTTWEALTAPPPDAAAAVRVPRATANAFGHRKLTGRPNLLRARLLETADATATEEDECLAIECNLDDTTPQIVGALTQALLAAGALDVFTTAIQMKKQRPGMLITTLCKPSDRDALVDLIFRESTTFGVREHFTRRTVLERRSVEAQTPFGPVRVKIGTWRGVDITRTPEYEDCLRCAQESRVPVRVVCEAARRAL